MRAINKQAGGGYHLARAHANLPQTKDQATSRWSTYGHKDELRNSLLEEQFFLCCYSEIRVDRVGLGCHIEHIQPKSSYPQRTFDYQNLAVSALDSENDLESFKTQGQEVFGGHAKLGEYDPILFVSCHQPDSARFFAYISNGRVEPALDLSDVDTAKAKYTIDLLNLNSPYLIPMRQRWWDELDELFAEHQAKDWSISDLVELELVPINNKINPFFSLTRHFFGHVAEQILQQQAPQLI